MIILTIRTDKPEAEIGLYNDHKQIDYMTWQAHKHLAETIHQKLQEITHLQDIEGIVIYKGPGSFTGLRIGLSVANALAYSQGIPIIAATDDWIEQGIKQLLEGKNDKVALPDYGAPVHITQQKK